MSSPEPEVDDTGTVVKQAKTGPLPFVDQLLSGTSMGDRLSALIEQAGSTAAPSSVVLQSLVGGIGRLVLGGLLFRVAWHAPGDRAARIRHSRSCC